MRESLKNSVDEYLAFLEGKPDKVEVTKYIFKFSELALPIISTNIDLSIINVFRN